jgi:hypothetical protein
MAKRCIAVVEMAGRIVARRYTSPREVGANDAGHPN